MERIRSATWLSELTRAIQAAGVAILRALNELAESQSFVQAYGKLFLAYAPDKAFILGPKGLEKQGGALGRAILMCTSILDNCDKNAKYYTSKLHENGVRLVDATTLSWVYFYTLDEPPTAAILNLAARTGEGSVHTATATSAVLEALGELPRWQGKVLFRGLSGRDPVEWKHFFLQPSAVPLVHPTACSSVRKVAETYAAKSGETGVVVEFSCPADDDPASQLLIDVGGYSVVSSECEVVLLPGLATLAGTEQCAIVAATTAKSDDSDDCYVHLPRYERWAYFVQAYALQEVYANIRNMQYLRQVGQPCTATLAHVSKRWSSRSDARYGEYGHRPQITAVTLEAHERLRTLPVLMTLIAYPRSDSFHLAIPFICAHVHWELAIRRRAQKDRRRRVHASRASGEQWC